MKDVSHYAWPSAKVNSGRFLVTAKIINKYYGHLRDIHPSR